MGARVYSIHAIKADPPYLTFRALSLGIEDTHDGPCITHPRMEVACHAADQNVALDLAQKVIQALVAWPEAGYADSVSIDDYDESFDPQIELYRVAIAFEVWI